MDNKITKLFDLIIHPIELAGRQPGEGGNLCEDGQQHTARQIRRRYVQFSGGKICKIAPWDHATNLGACRPPALCVRKYNLDIFQEEAYNKNSKYLFFFILMNNNREIYIWYHMKVNFYDFVVFRIFLIEICRIH